ncbi:MAG: PE domain-containing protein [Pseudonocardia sp.]
MTTEQVLPPRGAPGAGSTQAMFDEHYAGVLSSEALRRRVGVAVGGGPSGVVVHDPDALRQALAKLRAAVTTMDDGLRRWRAQRAEEAVGIDPVSVQLRVNMSEMRRRALHYAEVWTEQLRATHAALQAQLDSYEAVERANRDRLARS